MAIHQNDHGNETVGGKVHIAHALARLAQHVGKYELNFLAAGQDMQAVLAGQASEESINSLGGYDR